MNVEYKCSLGVPLNITSHFHFKQNRPFQGRKSDKMKFFVVFAVCIASAYAGPYGAPQIRFGSVEAPVVRESHNYAPAVRTPMVDKEAPTYQQAAPVEVRTYASAPVEVKAHKYPEIIKYTMKDDNYGTYDLQVHTADGAQSSEIGSVKQGPEGAYNVKQGEYSYTVDGQTFTTRWIADENGYRAFGDHLPTSAPMSEEIKKSLEMPRVAVDDYSSKPAVRVQSSYEAPTPVVRAQQSYETPVARVQQYQAPAPVVRVQQSYETPAPVVRVQKYETPVVRVQQSYETPAAPVIRVQNYETPVVRVQKPYVAPAPVVRVQQSYETPAPVVRVAPTSYHIKSEGY